MRRTKEVFLVFGSIVVPILIVAALYNYFLDRDCLNYEKITGLKTQYVSGCYVLLDDAWYPKDSVVRVLDGTKLKYTIRR